MSTGILEKPPAPSPEDHGNAEVWRGSAPVPQTLIPDRPLSPEEQQAYDNGDTLRGQMRPLTDEDIQREEKRKKAASEPTPEQTIEPEPAKERLRSRVWGRVREVAQKGTGLARAVAHRADQASSSAYGWAVGWLAGTQNELTDLQRSGERRLNRLAAVGTYVTGMAIVVVNRPEMLKPLAAPAVDFAGDVAHEIGSVAGDIAQNFDSGYSSAEAADMQPAAQAAAVPPHSADTAGSQEFTPLSQVTQTSPAEGPAGTLPETTQVASHTPSSGEDLTDQLSLQRDEHGNLVTEGLEAWNKQPREGELFQPGTGYNTMERLLREAGLNNDQIKQLDESGKLRELVGGMLKDSGAIWSSEATGAEGELPDTNLPEGFQFKIGDGLRSQIGATVDELNPQEASPPGEDTTGHDEQDPTAPPPTEEPEAETGNGHNAWYTNPTHPAYVTAAAGLVGLGAGATIRHLQARREAHEQQRQHEGALEQARLLAERLRLRGDVPIHLLRTTLVEELNNDPDVELKSLRQVRRELNRLIEYALGRRRHEPPATADERNARIQNLLEGLTNAESGENLADLAGDEGINHLRQLPIPVTTDARGRATLDQQFIQRLHQLITDTRDGYEQYFSDHLEATVGRPYSSGFWDFLDTDTESMQNLGLLLLVMHDSRLVRAQR